MLHFTFILRSIVTKPVFTLHDILVAVKRRRVKRSRIFFPFLSRQGGVERVITPLASLLLHGTKMRVIDKEFLLHISVFGSFNGIDFVLKLFYFNCFCFKDFQHLLQSSLQLLNIFGKITVFLVTVGMKIRALVAKLALAKPEVVPAGLGVPVLAALVAKRGIICRSAGVKTTGKNFRIRKLKKNPKKWSEMVKICQNGLKWSRMVQNGPNCSPMIKNV